jgi:hypothetical protein
MTLRLPLAAVSATLMIGAPLAAGSGSEIKAASAADATVTLTAVPPRVTNATSATFAFTSVPLANNYKCRLDGGEFSTCTSPQLYSGLRDGSHLFEVYAPALGRTPTSYAWTVDTVAPNTTITATPPIRSTSAVATFAFTSSERNSTFVCSLDGSGFIACAASATYFGIPDGTHSFRVQAVDAAGNADTSAATFAWTIIGGHGSADYTPPGDVANLQRSVGYGRLRLRWENPADNDFDHVEIYVSTSPRSQPRTRVYRGEAHTYTSKRFKNGRYYRYRVVSLDHARNASRGALTTIRPSALLRSPRDGRVVHRPPLLQWARVSKATFYNVQLYRKGGKILSAWPTTPRLALMRHWTFDGRHFLLRRGLYVWYVWPAFGSRTKSRYGQMLGQGSFRFR